MSGDLLFQRVERLCNDVYNFFSTPHRLEILHQWQVKVHGKQIGIKQSIDSRWLARHDALDAITRSYVAILLALHDDRLLGENGAAALRQEFLCYKTHLAFSGCLDILFELQRLNLVFQSDTVNFTFPARKVSEVAIAITTKFKLNHNEV